MIGQTARDQIALRSIPFILSGRLGLQAPLVVRNKIYQYVFLPEKLCVVVLVAENGEF